MPGTEPYWIETFGRVAETGVAEQIERWHQPTGRWVHSSAARVGGSGSRRLVSVFYDITERKRAEIALRESESRFQQFANASSSGLWIRNADTLRMEFVSPAISAIYGVEPGAFLGDIKHWISMILPEDRDAARHHLEQARHGDPAIYEFRIRRSDGSFRWIRNTDFPLFDEMGNVERVGGIAEDVTATRMAVEHQRVLIAELQHRVRNLLGMIRSMANRSANGPNSIEDFRSSLEGRLLALARVQTLLTSNANAGGSLGDIIETEIAALAHHRGQYEIVGPEIKVSPKIVEVLTLAFHELSTNALKCGGLSVESGKVVVRWTTFDQRGARWLSLDWSEEGAPPREPTTRRGFGRELIEGKVPYELRGNVKVTIENGQARCHMEIPLTKSESILETDAPAPVTVHGGSLDMSGAPDLSKCSVLVVEDEFYMASDIASSLRSAGAEVLGPCPTEEATHVLLGLAKPTHVVLDLNLGDGGPKFSLARLMRDSGIPVIFVTGYDPDVIPEDMRDVPRLQKPIHMMQVVDAVSRL